MKPTPPAHNRDGVRLKVLWPLALVMVVILLGVILAKSHSSSRPSSSGTDSAATIGTGSNVTAAPGESAAHSPRMGRSSSSQSDTEPETDRLAALLFDQNAIPQYRRQSAGKLASIGTERAIAALKSGLTNDLPPYVKAAIAEGLGHVYGTEASDLLHNLLHAPDQAVARGAVRGLAAHGDAEAANTLGTLLFNEQAPLSVRTEAALALGDVDLPAAQDFLTRAIAQLPDEDIRENVLDGLGRRPFSETQDFFKNYLNSPDVPTEAKVQAIEAVRDVDDDVIPFLSKYVNDANPAVSAAAKEAVDFLEPEQPKAVSTK